MMNSALYIVPSRGVRSLSSQWFSAPWPLVKKSPFGHRKIGPVVMEKHKYPGQNREFSEISPKFQKLNMPATRNYTHVQESGYVDPETGEYVTVKEMQGEIVVPDLTNFKLRPYVSFQTDVEIEKRRRIYEDAVIEKGSEEAADLKVLESERWPPPRITAKTLFDLYYAPKIRELFQQGRYAAVEGTEEDKVDEVSDKKKTES